MPYVASIGTYLPCWGGSQHRVADYDIGEVHDFFTGVALIGYEDLGFAERFGAFKILEAEDTTIDGGHDLGGPTALSAVTILEGPVAHGR